MADKREGSREQPQAGQQAANKTAPKMYPNQPCYSHLLWLGNYEVRSGFSDESRHTTGSSGADFKWKEGFPEDVYLPKDYFE